MSRSAEANRSLAAALRAAGFTDVRPVWARAKALMAEGWPEQQIAFDLASSTHKAPAPAPRAPKAPKPAPRAQQLAPAPVQGWQRVPVAFANGSQDVLVLSPARPSTRARAGSTHDAHLLGGTERFTVSPRQLSKLLAGGRVGIPVGNRLTVATRA